MAALVSPGVASSPVEQFEIALFGEGGKQWSWSVAFTGCDPIRLTQYAGYSLWSCAGGVAEAIRWELTTDRA